MNDILNLSLGTKVEPFADNGSHRFYRWDSPDTTLRRCAHCNATIEVSTLANREDKTLCPDCAPVFICQAHLYFDNDAMLCAQPAAVECGELLLCEEHAAEARAWEDAAPVTEVA